MRWKHILHRVSHRRSAINNVYRGCYIAAGKEIFLVFIPSLKTFRPAIYTKKNANSVLNFGQMT